MSKARASRPPPVPFLPMTQAELAHLGWAELDVLLITGDAYVDHPAFGAALLGRWLVAHGFRVGIVAQPRWDAPADIVRLGRPRLAVGVTAGALDSLLAHYTAFRKKRQDDAYTPGGRAGARPNRACTVYANLARQAFPGVPVLVGGIEASLRRITHYDFWTDGLRRSLLLDAKADLLVYGMAERALLEAVRRLEAAAAAGTRPAAPVLRGVPGTVWVAAGAPALPAGAEVLTLPAHADVVADPRRLMEATLLLERQVHADGVWATQAVDGRTLVLAPPAAPLTADELDAVYALPFARRAHPSYGTARIPALDMVQFSITAHRGCAGGCTFCSLALHQGRRLQSRSRASVLAEVDALVAHPDWRGSITDVGGPTANMWGASCAIDARGCRRASCLFPAICRHFTADQGALAALLAEVARRPGVRHVRTASGIRHDLALRDPAYLEALVSRYVGGQLKIAPEHGDDRVLALMRKPPFATFTRFMERFDALSRACGKEQYLVPYLISAFPGCTDEDMRRLGRWLKARGWSPQQVQCFIPTPGTVATAMYVTGQDPEGRPIPVARTDAERLRQHHALGA